MDIDDLSSESSSINSSRSETDVEETTISVSETQPGSRPLGDHVREGQNLAIGGITEGLQEFNFGPSVSSALKDIPPAAINPRPSGHDEGTSTYPVQDNLEQQQAPPKTSTDAQLTFSKQRSDDADAQSTIGSRAHNLQSLSEDSEIVKLRLDYEKFQESISQQFENVAETVVEMRKKLDEMESANAAERKKLINALDVKMLGITSMLSLQIIDIHKSTGTSPDGSLEVAWKELLSQVGLFKPGKFFEVDPSIISYECSTRPNGKALVYVRESFKGLFESIMSVHNAHWVQSTASNQARRPTDRNPDPATQATQDQMRESNTATGSTTATDQTNPIATDTENQTDEAPASPTCTTARTTPIAGKTDELTSTKGPGGNYLVTGTPGTGKSCFAYYLLPHLLAKEGDSVLYQNCHKDMNFFVVITRSKDNEFKIEHYQMPNNSLPKPMHGFLKKPGKDSVEERARVSWYIFDSGHKSGAKPESAHVPTIVISSPDCYQLKDFMLKCPKKFYMPTWEWPEINAVVRKLHPDKSSHLDASIQKAKADYSQEEINNEEKKERIAEAFQTFSEHARASEAFSKHGGVIRDVLNPCSEGRLEALHAAVNQSNVKMVLQFLQVRGDVSSAVSHRILHQKCDKMLENGLVDYQNPSIHFASKHVHDRFWAKHLQNNADLKIEQLSLMYELLPADKSTHSEECRRKFGEKFEELVHTAIARGPHEAKKLSSQTDKAKNKLKSISLEFTSKIIRPSQYQKTDDHIVCTIGTEAEDKEAYVRPSKGNFPAFDAFLPNQKYLLQITIAKNHPVAVPELLSFIYTRGWRPKDVTLVFVVLDQIYDSFSYQDHKKTKKQKQNKTQESEKLEEVNKLSPEEIEDFKKIKQCALPMPPRQLLHKQ